jgi:hypothetical protein
VREWDRWDFTILLLQSHTHAMPSPPEPQPLTDYVADGARIAAILIIWAAFGAFFRYGVTEFTTTFERVFTQLGGIFVIIGVLNALLYISYRTVDYWRDGGGE